MPRRIACYASGATTQSWKDLVGLGRFELPTSPLSGVRSNQLSYRPISLKRSGGAMRDRTADLFRAREALSQLSYSPVTGLFAAALRCHRRSVSHIGLLCSLLLSSGASISTKNPALPYFKVTAVLPSRPKACQSRRGTAPCINNTQAVLQRRVTRFW